MDNALAYGEAIKIAELRKTRRVQVTRLVLPYFLAALMVAFFLFLYLWTRVSVMTLNYEIATLNQQEHDLARENRELLIQYDTETSPARLDAIGKERFNLLYPEDSAVIPVR
jgi:cell division protein FtsL